MREKCYVQVFMGLKERLVNIHYQNSSLVKNNDFCEYLHGARSIGPKFPEIPVQNHIEENVSETRFVNFGQPPEAVLFSRNLEIQGISCSIGHYHSVSFSSRPKRRRWQAGLFTSHTSHVSSFYMTQNNFHDTFQCQRRDDTFRTILGREVS